MDTKEIVLSDGSAVLVDLIDYEWASSQRWSRSSGTATKPGYAAHGGTQNGRRWLRYMHREIAVRAGILTAYDDPLLTDHIDRNTNNNSRSNLRAVTASENNRNRRATGRSGILGVYEHRAGWGFEIQMGRRRIRRYGFATPAEAAAAREVVGREMAA